MQRWLFIALVPLAGCPAGEEVWPADALAEVSSGDVSSGEVSAAETSVLDAAVDAVVEADAASADGEVGPDAPTDAGPPPLWQPTGGPWSTARVNALAVNGSDWVASTRLGFVFRSRDGGDTFEPWPDDFARARNVWSLGVAISRGQVVVTHGQGVFSAPVGGGPFKKLLGPSSTENAFGFVAATASGAWLTNSWLDFGSPAAVRRSVDSGATWSTTAWSGPSPFFRAEGESVFLGEEKTASLGHSLDGGATFTSIPTPRTSVQDAVITKTHLVVAQKHSLAVRPLGSTTWKVLSEFSSTWDASYSSLTHDGDTVVALSPLTSFRTTDGGATWAELPGVHVNAVGPGAVSGSAMAVATNGSGLQRSLDGGRTWSSHGRGLQASRIWQVAARPGAPATLFALDVDSYALLKSTNAGREWTSLDKGGKAFVFSGGALLVTGYNLVLRSTDDGATFTPVLDYLGSASPMLVSSGSVVLATSIKGFVRSTDGGATWTKHPAPILDRRLAVSPTGAFFLATVADGIMRSTDAGLTWTHSTTLLNRPQDVAIAPDGSAYVSTDEGDLHRSIDGGDTWVKIHSLGKPSRLGFTPAGELLAPSVTADGRMLLLRRVADGTFARFDEGLWASEIFSYTIGDGTLYVGTNAGVYRLTR